MRTATFTSLLCLAIVCTSLLSAIFATTLAAGALATLPRSQMGYVQMAANAPTGVDAKSTVTR